MMFNYRSFITGSIFLIPLILSIIGIGVYISYYPEFRSVLKIIIEIGITGIVSGLLLFVLLGLALCTKLGFSFILNHKIKVPKENIEK